MTTTRNYLQFSGKETQVFLLQDNKGFHVFLQHPLVKEVEKKLEEDTVNTGSNAERTLIITKAAFSAMTTKDRIVSCCATNTTLKSQRRSLVACSRRSQSPTLPPARTINYYLSTGLLHISEQNVLPILEISLRLGLSAVQEACTLLISKTLPIANWSKILRLARDYHSRSLTNTFTMVTSRYIMKCLAKKDLVSLIGSLTHSKADRQSLKFFLKRFLRSGKKKNLVKVMFEVLNSEAKMLQFCFKDCLDCSKLSIQNVDNSKDKAQDIKTKINQMQTFSRKSVAQKNLLQSTSSLSTKIQSILPSSHQTHIGRRNVTKEQPPNLSLSLLGFDHNRLKSTTRTDGINSPGSMSSSLRPLQRTPTVREVANAQSTSADNVNDVHSPKVLKQVEKRISCVKLIDPPTTQKRQRTVPFDASQTQTQRREKREILDTNSTKSISANHLSSALPSDQTLILISGGITNEYKPEPTNLVFMFSQSKERWIKLPSMNSKRYNHSIVSIGDKVIAIGGNTRHKSDNKMKGNSRMTKSTKDTSARNTFHKRNLLEPSQTNSVEQLSIKNDVGEWSTVYSSILSREEHYSVVVGEQVYTIGGHDGICQLCSVERYNPITNRWSLEKPMSRLLTGASAVTDGRHIYVIGGYGGLKCLNTIECYDTVTKSWSRDHFQPMVERRGYACAEMLNNDIYVFGGTNGHENLKTCEVFDFKMKKWRKGPEMSQPRLNAGHCVFNGRILVLGGESDGRFLDTVEQLDTAVWDWKPFCKLPFKVAGLKCTIITRN